MVECDVIVCVADVGVRVSTVVEGEILNVVMDVGEAELEALVGGAVLSVGSVVGVVLMTFVVGVLDKAAEVPVTMRPGRVVGELRVDVEVGKGVVEEEQSRHVRDVLDGWVVMVGNEEVNVDEEVGVKDGDAVGVVENDGKADVVTCVDGVVDVKLGVVVIVALVGEGFLELAVDVGPVVVSVVVGVLVVCNVVGRLVDVTDVRMAWVGVDVDLKVGVDVEGNVFATDGVV